MRLSEKNEIQIEVGKGRAEEDRREGCGETLGSGGMCVLGVVEGYVPLRLVPSHLTCGFR